MNNKRRIFIGQVSLIAGVAALAKPIASVAAINKHLNTFSMYTPDKQGCPVVHFEIGCTDTERTNKFYTSIFGWSGNVSPMASMLNTNTDKGVQGHITNLGHEPKHYVTFYIEVDDIPAYLSKVEEAGGKKIVGPIKLPDGKQFAWFSDPDANVIGLLTP
jgi:predicted enzyme related to lactoylglutathione lyase